MYTYNITLSNFFLSLLLCRRRTFVIDFHKILIYIGADKPCTVKYKKKKKTHASKRKIERKKLWVLDMLEQFERSRGLVLWGWGYGRPFDIIITYTYRSWTHKTVYTWIYYKHKKRKSMQITGDERRGERKKGQSSTNMQMVSRAIYKSS